MDSADMVVLRGAGPAAPASLPTYCVPLRLLRTGSLRRVIRGTVQFDGTTAIRHPSNPNHIIMTIYNMPRHTTDLQSVIQGDALVHRRS